MISSHKSKALDHGTVARVPESCYGCQCMVQSGAGVSERWAINKAGREEGNLATMSKNLCRRQDPGKNKALQKVYKK